MASHYDKKRVAKNTITLYIRMIFVSLIGIYTGRVVLEILGVDDYGTYVTVGGMMGFMSFLYAALATGTSRFITVGLGKNNPKELNLIFSSALNVHLIMALFVGLLSEPIGLWLIHNKLNLPPDSLSQVHIVFQCSIISMCLPIIMSPFNAAIIAHEKIGAFAYLSIWDVSAKLGILYLLTMFPQRERLGLYAVLVLAVVIIDFCLYIIYCFRHFPEVRWRPVIDKRIFKEIGVFSGWSIFSTTAWALNTQIMLVLLNMFFGPAIVAARAVSNTVNGVVNSFVTNFRTAVNPQIIKSHASGDEETSRKLLLSSTKFSFFMLLLIALPAILLASPVLHLWLVEVPPYAVPFLQLTLVQSMIQVFDNSFYTALYAKGQLKQNALLSPTCLFISFGVVYLCFKLGSSPLALAWSMIGACSTIAFFVKPYLLVKIVDYKYSEIWKMISVCFSVVVVSLPLPIIFRIFTPENWLYYVLCGLISVVSVSLTIWTIGVDYETRGKIKEIVKAKLKV